MTKNSTLKVAFAGTPEFAASALQAILGAGYRVPLVLTQPDRPAGRGLQLQSSEVKTLALQHSISVAQPRSLRLDGKYPDAAEQGKQQLETAQPDVLVVAAYGLILPQWVLDVPRLGCLNIHASLLPRWRGAAPIHRAIEAGDCETGVTIMQMDAGLDTGDMLLKQSVAISSLDSTATLHDTLAALGAKLLLNVLAALQRGEHLPATPQPKQGVTYAHKIEKREAALDFSLPAAELACKIRAFDAAPGCTARWQASLEGEAEVLKLWHAQAVPVESSNSKPGQVLRANAQGVLITCGKGAINVTELQRAGGKRLNAAAFLQGVPLQTGCVLY